MWPHAQRWDSVCFWSLQLSTASYHESSTQSSRQQPETTGSRQTEYICGALLTWVSCYDSCQLIGQTDHCASTIPKSTMKRVNAVDRTAIPEFTSRQLVPGTPS